MANTIGWGKGSINNTIGWGQATKNNTIGYGEIEKVSWTGETNITGLSGFEDTTSFAYDGVDDKLQTASTWDALDGDLITNGGFTISVWFKVDDLSSTRSIFRSWNSGGSVQVAIDIFSSGVLQVFTGGSGSNWSRTNTAIVTGTWYHIVMRMDSTNSDRYTKQQIWLNGTQDFYSNFFGGTMPNGASASIGINGYNNTNDFFGNINEFAVYPQYVLTDAEIVNIYNNGVPNDLADTNNVSRLPSNWVRSENGSWNGREWDVPNYDDASNENWLSFNMNEDARQNDVPLPASFTNIQSVEFDGVDDYIETNAIYSELNGGTKLTLSVWIKPISASPLLEYVLSNPRDTTANNSQFALVLYENNSISFNVQSRTSQYVSGNINAITYGAWNHILVCVDLNKTTGTEGAIFINGIDETITSAMGTLTSFYTATDRLHIGIDANGGFNSYNGHLDELAIYSGSDLRNDVATLYNNGIPNNLNDNGLIAPTSYYRFEGTGTTAIDSGSAGNNATLQNGVIRSTDIPT